MPSAIAEKCESGLTCFDYAHRMGYGTDVVETFFVRSSRAS
jgi:hypothetical protein